MSIAISQICLGFNGLASGENPLNLRVIQDALIRLTQVSEVNEVNEVKGRCHWDVVYFSALNRTAKLLSFNFVFFCSSVVIQQRGKRMCMCHKRKCRKRRYQRIQPLLRKRYRYRSKNPARSSDHKMRKIQLQQLRTKMLTFSFLFVFLERVKQSIAY